MRGMIPSALMVAMLAVSAANADPVGKYSISGTNPEDGKKYTGTVEVARVGETYTVVWTIGKDVINGTAIAGYIRDGNYVAGSATDDDTVLSVAYGSGNSHGVAIYIQQNDDVWEGVWAYSGSGKVTTELWLKM